MPSADEQAPDGHELRVRLADNRDEAAIRDLLIGFGYPEDSLDHLRDRLDHGDSGPVVLVAERDRAVIGVGSLTISTVLERANPQARVTVLVVADEERAHGAGRKLVEALEKAASTRGCTRVELTSAHSLTGAHAFWRALGYQETGLRFAKVIGDEPRWRPPAPS